MSNRSRSTLFLIEQLIVIAVFALCAAACVTILTDAYFTANNSKDISNALLAAESGAEIYKASSGDLGRVAQIMGGVSNNASGGVAVYYDKQWQVCGETLAFFRLDMVAGAAERSASLSAGDITVVNLLTNEQLVAFTVVARS